MADIYSQTDWTSGEAYEKDDIVIFGGKYYYATVDHTSGTFLTDFSSGKWDGIINTGVGLFPKFFWSPSYGYGLTIKPLVKKIQFGDGYINEFPDGINNVLLPFDVTFEDRGLAEYSAIIHFLHARAGCEKFYFIPPAPFNVLKKFVCQELNATQVDYEKYSIKCKFEERV